MDVQIDTESLEPGAYKLLIWQQDGKSHALDFKILPNPPKIDNLPILVNQGNVTQHFVLKGERLGQLRRLEAPGAVLNLSPPSTDQTERNLTVELKSFPRPGTALLVNAYLDDHTEPLAFPGALEITGPLPVIASSKLSLPKGMAISVHPDEFPAGYTLNALLDVKNIERQSILWLGCADGVGQHAALHIGEQTAAWSLQQLSPDQLFLAFDTSGLPAGCSLQAEIDNGRNGGSKPFTLAHILRVPQIDSFTGADTPPQSPTRQYQLTGQNLEMIEKIGWDRNSGLEVAGLPTPLPGPGLKQSIQIKLPDPPTPKSSVYIWLRGDKQGRGTTVMAPTLPVQPPPTLATATTVTSSLDRSYVGQAVTFTATVSPVTATGTITFKRGDAALGTAALSSGQAALTTSSLTDGSLPITAAYSGDANYAGSSSPPLTQTVDKGTTAVSINSSPNPSSTGQTVMFRAVVTVTSSAGGSPTGVVNFIMDDTILGTGTVDSTGTATFNTSALNAGKYNVKAVYAGSPALTESTSAPIAIVVQ